MTVVRRFVSYLRVSTDAQGKSGLGLEAQRHAILTYLNGGSWELTAEFVEVESGKVNDRPQLLDALRRCRLTGATLLVAKLDRLSRNAAFLLTLRDSGVEFVCADMPEANRLTIGIMALVAEQEREAISKRTKDALQAAKARGTKLGGFRGHKVDQRMGVEARRKAAQAFAESLRDIVLPMREQGCTLQQIADKLSSDGIQTVAGGQWTPTAVRNVLQRL